MWHCCKSLLADLIYPTTNRCQVFVTPVSHIHYRGKDLSMPMVRGNSGDYAAVIKSWLKDIMYGKEQHKWGVIIEEEEL
jgi:branched-chain amino acid aminotransferase